MSVRLAIVRFPLTKVYRAFPELDAFNDAECMRFVRLARSGRRVAHLCSFFVGGMAGVVLVAVVYSPLSHFLIFLDQREVAEWLFVSCAVCSGLTIFLSPCVGVLLGRDVWLRRVIQSQLNRTTCPACRYSLLGLVVMGEGAEARVRCPECGALIRLADHALTPGELMAMPGSVVGGDRAEG